MMIVKPYTQPTGASRSPHLRAGAAAEERIAHYLSRTFASDPDVFVLNDLRLEDREQPEQDGSPGVCQIDHLVVHRYGMFIVESKSVTGEVVIRPDGSGDDEWSRVDSGREKGMASPIRQAERQSEFLRTFLIRNREKLLGRMPFGMRTLAKVLFGTDRLDFGKTPMQLGVAISDQGRIRRLEGWKEPTEPFPVFVAKADQVPKKIKRELERHRKGKLNIRPSNLYGLWAMHESEAKQLPGFSPSSMWTDHLAHRLIDPRRRLLLDEARRKRPASVAEQPISTRDFTTATTGNAGVVERPRTCRQSARHVALGAEAERQCGSARRGNPTSATAKSVELP